MAVESGLQFYQFCVWIVLCQVPHPSSHPPPAPQKQQKMATVPGGQWWQVAGGIWVLAIWEVEIRRAYNNVIPVFYLQAKEGRAEPSNLYRKGPDWYIVLVAKDIKGKMEMEAGREGLTFVVDVAESKMNTLLLRCLRMVIKDTVCLGIN